MNAPKEQAEKANAALEESYDGVPYESYVYSQTHPERLYTLGRLFQLSPADIHKARVLEIGCAGGGNLIPLAMLYPKTKCVGIDLSKEQIEHAKNGAKAMGLKNIEFRQMDVMNMDENIGQFDYIICHGVFSWVPPGVAETILEVCKKHLTPNGMAIVSYNAMPGWGAVKTLREMMLFHTQSFSEPAQQVREAKQLLNFLYENSAANESYRQIIDAERQILNVANDSYLFHDHLESENHQYYLHQFTGMANAKGLMYVGDAELSSMYLGNFNENVRKTLGEIGDVVRLEQYIDFLTNRRFRSSIITHKELGAKINRRVDPSAIMNFYLGARFKPENPSPAPGDKMKFTMTSNAASSMEAHDRETFLVFKALSDEGRPIKVDDLAAMMEKKEKIPAQKTRDIFLKNGFSLTLQGFITLHEGPVDFFAEVSKKPKAFAWARHMAADKSSTGVTNLKRETVKLAPLQKTLLMHLDGKNAKDALAKLLVEHVMKSELKIHKNGELVTDKKEVSEIIAEQITPTLAGLAAMALLEA